MPYYKWIARSVAAQYDRSYHGEFGRIPVSLKSDVEDTKTTKLGLYVLRRPMDALRFGEWPGRLFEAELVGPILAQDQQRVYCHGARLEREIDPSQVFGPNGSLLVEFLLRLDDFPWLRSRGPLRAAIDAILEHQSLLTRWGWRPVPVECKIVDDWTSAIDLAQRAMNPAVDSGACTAWTTVEHLWKAWVSPWAAWAAWYATWQAMLNSVSAAAWAMAREKWNGAVQWPALTDPEWMKTTYTIRMATKIISKMAAGDAATSAEYLVCSSGLPANPFEAVMEVWRLGYWPVGVVDGRYIIADMSSLCQW